MAKSKRRVPPAVQEQLDRKRRLTATMAERQSAALGKSAREQLKPLLEQGVAAAPTPKRGLRFDFSIDSDALNRAFANVTKSMLANYIGTWPSLSVEFAPPPAPSVDADKLEALKTAEPYKVAPRVPDMVEVITGWRAWTLSNSGRLEALGKDTVWPARQALEAVCGARQRHIAPAWDCSCGIWAFKDLDRLVAAIGSRYGEVRILGKVSLWGRVIETENGYRAEKAYPSELWLFDESLEELGLVYDVPVRMIRA